jgi:tetratricopeptide (TPR) repeat protein
MMVNKIMKPALLALTLTLCALMMGCGGGEGPGPAPVTYESKIAAGWQAFSQSQYHSALNEFKTAVEIDSSRAEGFDGSGWSYALLDSLQESLLAFYSVVSRDTTLVDSYVGMAAVSLGIPDYELAKVYASYALAQAPDFVFEHRARYDWRDLHLILAECYYATADYSSALAEVQVLDPTFEPDPLEENYLELLLLKIEALVAVYGGI